MFVLKMTQTGGFEEYRGMVTWYGGGLVPGLDHKQEPARAQRYASRSEAEREAERVRRARPQHAVEVVEIE